MPVVGLFATCLADFFRPQVALAALRLLEQTGARVVCPPAQTCCGQIAYNSGYRKKARQLAGKFAREFANCDFIVVPSGSCGGMLHVHAPELFGGDKAEDKDALAALAKCLELSQYLQQVNFVPQAQAQAAAAASGSAPVATFHDSCAGLRELGVKETPRRLLRQCGINLCEMPESGECCGFGGRFAEQFGAVSVALADKKCANINAAVGKGASAVIAGDLGCLLHLQGRLLRQQNPLPLWHWAEVVAQPSLISAAA